MTCSLLKTNPDTWKFSLSVLSSANRNGRTHVVQRLHLRLLSSSSPSSTTIQQEQARHVCPLRVGREIPPLCAVPRWRPRDRARGGRQRRRTTIYNLQQPHPSSWGRRRRLRRGARWPCGPRRRRLCRRLVAIVRFDRGAPLVDGRG